VPLADAVPVQAGSVIRHRVLQRNSDDVSPTGLDLRTRILPVDQKAFSGLAIEIAGAVCDFKVVVPDHTSVGPAEVEIR
jgi:hypothetical protein